MSRLQSLLDRRFDRFEYRIVTKAVEVGVRGDQVVGEPQLDGPAKAVDGCSLLPGEHLVAGQIVESPAARRERLGVIPGPDGFRYSSGPLKRDREVGTRFLGLTELAGTIDRPAPW